MIKSNHRILPETPFASYQDYLKRYGPFPLSENTKTPEAILAEIEKSGLRGRGGAGFPTGRKWRTLYEHPCTTRYVVCNAAEGEPGTFKDRFLLRNNPYAVLEGILIASQVIGAKEIYIAIKESFKKEISVLKKALQELRRNPILKKIPVKIVPGPEEYLFGEEKALLNVIEGEGPFPRPPEEPPYEIGLFSTPDSPNPALVNNVQTFAHVATILRFGADSFRKLGSPNTPGTLLFTLSGEIQRPGIYEMEAGSSLRKILQKAGGLKRNRRLKAILPGVSAPVLLPKHLDVPADFDSLKEIGSGLASAGFIVIDNSISILPVAQAITRFLYVESCTQCFACKDGLRRASEALDHILRGNRKAKDSLLDIKTAAESAPQGNRCYLPVQGSLLIPSLLKNFPKEFAEKKPGALKEWMIPKMTDYDSKRKQFVFDEAQALKQPDWTYLTKQ